MSGRSAYVRKKITETKGDKPGSTRSRAKSAASSEDNATITDYPMPGGRPGTGVPTTNARFLKFSEPTRESDMLNYRGDMPSYSTQSNGSQSGGSIDGRRDGAGTRQFKAPLDDFAYARARRPAIRTEDTSGIEKSGLRNILDKKSDEVRKGLFKTFNFKKKDRRDLEELGPDFRPQSSATVRPVNGRTKVYPSELDAGYTPQSNETLQAPPYQAMAETDQFWDGAGLPPPPPSAKLPPVPTATGTPVIKRWVGAGRAVQRWNKLRKDPELWDPNGDVLVFFAHRGKSPRPNPSFRLSSHIIEATESRHLITLLREGSTEEDILMPPSPMGAPPMLQRHGHAMHHHLSPPMAGYGRGGQPTPPISEDASLGESDGQISYEMYFPTPPNLNKIDQFRHHITTRNVFALLYHASLVGLSLYQALADLHARLDAYMPPEADNIGTIINYISARGIDDVRNDPETAVSLLAWSEGAEVRWEEGWRESFLHCAGMYGRLEPCADFKQVTPLTRALLERASLETQLRVHAAEERLAELQYADMWPAAVATTASASGPVTTSPAKSAADRLQRFLVAHYAQVYGRWPPLPPPPVGQDSHAIGTAHGGDGVEEMWLTRAVAQALQRDFSALYDYLVNRDIVWDGSEARSSRKWMLVSESRIAAFEADTPDLPMTDMLIEFDNKLRFPHIPHPYPLVPDSIQPFGGARESDSISSVSAGTFGGKQFHAKNGAANGGAASNGRTGAMERRTQLAYTEATNICLLGSEFTHSDLIDAFGKFEKSDRVGEVNPSLARRGRWVLIYGILQTLASVSVDAPNVRYRDDVPYHLSPRLKGAKMPPWKMSPPPFHNGGSSSRRSDEAAHELSHCWTVPRTWNAGGGGDSSTNSAADSSAEESGTSPAGVSPIAGMSRAYSFPRPPLSTTGRSSVAGYHTPAGARSVRSAGSSRAPSVTSSSAHNYPPLSSAASFMSESESVSGARTPASGASSRKGNRRSPGVSRAGTNIGRVDEHDWPVPGYGGQSYTTSSGVSSAGQYQLAPLKFSSSAAGHGGFLVLDDVVDDHTSFTTAVSRPDTDKVVLGMGRGGGGRSSAAGYPRPLLSGGSDTDSVAAVIKEFDDMDVIGGNDP